jgi:hypothetical protein
MREGQGAKFAEVKKCTVTVFAAAVQSRRAMREG